MLQRIVFISILVYNVKCHPGRDITNNTDVIVIDTGHAEAGDHREARPTNHVGHAEAVDHREVRPTDHVGHAEAVSNRESKPIVVPKHKEEEEEDVRIQRKRPQSKERMVPDDEKDVVFVPNEKTVYRNYEDDHYYQEDKPVRIKDVLSNKKTIKDVLESERTPIHLRTEPPPEVLFISGKNHDMVETRRREKENRKESRRNGIDSQPITTRKLNCSNLECNNTLKSICGGKMERKEWKYRSFLNECYFRKVNCAFKYEANRYIQVPGENCINIAGHYARNERSYYFKPIPEPMIKPDMLETVRNSSARRSLHIGIDGNRCTHPCPLQCTNDYEPECAVTPTGERRVFVNHCKLDYNSCVNGILWRRRPMSDCVGGKKADLHQNRAFINWMQRVGIVDNKGRLVLN